MIQRAGYPSIAAEVDESRVQEALPGIEARSWELVAMNNPNSNGQADSKKTKAQLIEELESLREKVGAR